MKRRRFLTGSVGIFVSAMGLGRTAFSAKPCPPRLIGSSSSGVTECDSFSETTRLAEISHSLAAGDSINFTRNVLQQKHDIQWQVQTIWYDIERQELQYMGKPASSQSTDYAHYVYDEQSDTWWTSGQSLFPGLGHIWDVTFDPINGDYWFRKFNENVLRWFDRSDGANGAWKHTVEQTSPALNSGNTNFAAMGWHPNLFGPGVPGIFIWAVFRFFAYDPAKQAFTVLSPNNFSSSSPLWNRSTGQALYLPATDQLICFAQDAGNGDPAILVDAGAGNSADIVADGLITVTTQPPIPVWGGGGTSNHGHVIPHPDDPNRLLLLDEHGSSRVWESSDYGKTWRIMGYSHPFQEMINWSPGEYTVGVIPPYGVVVGMTSTEDGGETVIWKPNQ